MNEDKLAQLTTPDHQFEPRAYSPPEIEDLGHVAELTQAVRGSGTF